MRYMQALLAAQRSAWAQRVRWRAPTAPPPSSQWLAVHASHLLGASPPVADRLATISLLHTALRRFPSLAPALADALLPALAPSARLSPPLCLHALFALMRALLRRLPPDAAPRPRLEAAVPPLLAAAAPAALPGPVVAQLLAELRPAAAAAAFAALAARLRLVAAAPPPSAWHPPPTPPACPVAPFVPLLPSLAGACPALDAWLAANAVALSAADVVHLAHGNDDWLLRAACALLRLRLAPPPALDRSAAWFLHATGDGGALSAPSLLAALARSQHSAAAAALLFADLVLECDPHALRFLLLYAKAVPPGLSGPDHRLARRVLAALRARLQRAHHDRLVPFNAAPLLRALSRALSG